MATRGTHSRTKSFKLDTVPGGEGLRRSKRLQSADSDPPRASPKVLKRAADNTTESDLPRAKRGRIKSQVGTRRPATEHAQASLSSANETTGQFSSSKRLCAAEGPSDDAYTPRTKRRRTSLLREAAQGESADNPVAFWAQENKWPPEYCDPSPMERVLARKKSAPSLRRKRSESGLSTPSSTTPSDQKPREEKSAPYRNPQYELVLNTKGTFMDESELDIADASKRLCQNLLGIEQTVPKETLFDDDVFKEVCRNLQGKNEARVIQDITRLIVASAETLALRNKSLKHLAESVNEGWNNSVPLTSTRPQPDYSVGFKMFAFTKDQLEKMSPIIGDWASGDQSYFLATYYMYFPFLTCEVKCGVAALNIADRQNAHSMVLAVRAIVELFRLVGREAEVHRQILAFSISHDDRSVRIYGHYPVIDGKDTKYYRHPIHEFSFTALDGKEKWTAYRFTKNVYNVWMPNHFERICSAIDQLPSKLDFDVPALSESTGLSQGLESHHLASSEGGSASLLVDEDDQLRKAGQMATLDTSFSKPRPSKRRQSPVKKS
ncbi:hypothetical protein EKO27_g7734 [Xylaria grammica]|uniref:DUF7924 domain-containing protein n=1 Tax=Xylaria grammica TaxID=363999 RepID=A0A439CZ15_9PEZI|nr:hypothetical protein EKO27_g7734 [Xylaria grammica]